MKKFNKFMSEAKGYGDVNRAVGSAQDKLDRAQAKNVTSKGKKLGVLADPYSGKPTKQEVWEYKGKKWLVLGKSVEVFVPMKYHKVIKENFVLRDGEYLKKGTPVKWKAADGKEVEGKIEGHQSGRYIDEILVTKSKSKFYKPGDYAYDVYASDIGVTFKEDIEQVDEGFKQLKNIKNTHPEMVRFDQMKWYRKLVKQLKDEPGEEIVLTIEKPSDSYRKTSGFGDSVSVRQQDISGIGLGKTKTEKLGDGGIRTTKVLAINENVRQIDELFGLGKKKDKQHKYKAGDELPELGGTIRFKSKKFPGFTLEGSPFTRLSGKRYEVSIKDVVNFKDRSKLGLQKYNKAIGNVEVVSAKDIIEIVKYNQFGKYATKKTPQEKDRFDRNDYGININDIKKGQYVEYSDKGKSSKHSIIGKVTGIGDDELVYVEVYKSTDPRIKPGSGRKMVYFGWIKRILDRSAVTEDIANAAGGPLGSNPSTGTIAGYDPMLKKKPLKRSKFAGTECFEVDNDTFQKCHTGHGKHERWDKYLKDDCDTCKTIRAYAKRYPQKDIVIQRAGCGTMTWLKKKGVHY